MSASNHVPAFYLCGLLLNCSAGALQQNAVISGIISVAASSVPPSRILLHLLHGHELRNPLLTCALALSLFAACLCVYIRVIIHRCRLQPSHLIIFLLLIVGESYQSREHGPNRARIPSHNNFVSLSSFLFGLLFYTSPPLLLLLLFFRVFSFFQLGFVRLLRVLNTHTHTDREMKCLLQEEELYKLIQRLWQRCRPFLRHDSIFLPSFLGGFLFLTLSLSLYLLLIHSLIQCVYESLFLETSTFGITKRTLVIIKDLLPFVVDQPHQLSVVSLCPLKKQNKMHQVYL